MHNPQIVTSASPFYAVSRKPFHSTYIRPCFIIILQILLHTLQTGLEVSSNKQIYLLHSYGLNNILYTGTIFQDVILYKVVEKSVSSMLVECSVYSLTLKMALLQFSELSVNIYWTVSHPKYIIPYIHYCENLKSNKLYNLAV